MTRLAAGLVLALLSSVALNSGFHLQHAASAAAPALRTRHPIASLSALVADRRWLRGFVTGLSGWALYILALRLAPLALVQAASAGGLGVLALLASRSGERLGRRERAAVAVSVGGLGLLCLSLTPPTPRATVAWAGPLAWTLASLLLAGLAAGRPGRRLAPGAGLAAASGVLYAAGDVSTKAAVAGAGLVFAGLLLACHGLGFVSLQLAFQRGTALATAGVSTLLTNALPILAGVSVFGERLPAGPAGVARVLGLAGPVLGAALLASAGRPRGAQAGAGTAGTAGAGTAGRGAEADRPRAKAPG